MTFVAVLIASLAGSTHCVAMCGGLMMAATGKRLSQQFAYHLGRAGSYTALGAGAGWVGNGLVVNLALAPLQVLLASVMIVLVLWSGVQVWTGREARIGTRVFQSLGLSHVFEHSLRFSREKSSVSGSWSLGALSVFLPCGWLYSFLLIAVASGSTVSGALTMFAFWTGTVPLLAVSRILVQALLARLAGGRVDVLTRRLVAIGIVCLGLFSIYTHARGLKLDSVPTAEVSCH